MKEKLFKFKVSSVQYAELLRDELEVIKAIIGDYEIVKKRDCPMGFDMKIWCRKKDNNKKTIDEIVKVIKSIGFDENKMFDIYEILKKYGKI